ncbi:MAG: 4'-phosphopantetheinyl transferase superfamily protein, partial [Clostridiales bacterium]|nr:4'-phosphopantetheinyl transferase superfamily protein [Clostridiales bacterium]
MLKVFALAVGAELAGGGRLAAGKLAAGEYEYLAAGAERVADAELAAGAELAVDTERVAGGRLAADEFAAGECLSADEYEALRGLVSREKAERLGRFRRFADAARSLLGDVMARRAICLATGLQNCELRFELGERQKPMLAAPMQGAAAAGAPRFSMPHSGGHGAGLAAGAGLGPAVVAPARDGSAIAGSAGAGPAIAGLPHFNISHSGRHVVCALCDAPVGIDVEIVRPIDMNIANRFFSADERGRLFSEPADGHGRLELFYSIWTRKESFIKMTGEGLSRPLGSFSVFGPLAWGGGAACCRRIGVGGDAICHVCHA